MISRGKTLNEKLGRSCKLIRKSCRSGHNFCQNNEVEWLYCMVQHKCFVFDENKSTILQCFRIQGKFFKC